jgi:hypothetical protein
MSRDVTYLTDHSINSEHTLRLAEHEVLLSFVNDAGAVAFYEWWNSVGKDTYGAWCAEHLEEYEGY